jgi:hypothetical protein
MDLYRLQHLVNQGTNVLNFSLSVNNLLTLDDGMPEYIITETFEALFDNIEQLQQNARVIQRERIRHLRMQQRTLRLQAHANSLEPSQQLPAPELTQTLSTSPPDVLLNDDFLPFNTMDNEEDIFGDDDIQVNEIMARTNSDETRSRVFPRMKKPISKTVKKTEFDSMMDDSCGICLDTRTRGETITTSCGHNYCNTCFDALVQSRKQQILRKDKVVHCPHCRSVNPQITVFKMRKPRTRNTRIVNYSGDDVEGEQSSTEFVPEPITV